MAMKTAEELLERYGSTLVDDAVAYTRIVQRNVLEEVAKGECSLCHSPGAVWQKASKWGDTWQHLPTHSEAEPRRCAMPCHAPHIHDLKADLEPTP